ncbi:hypothetical protein HK101_005177 [Irineochytrium annulatum]|nr:hypothetical protein HK101_005177 [Irineochytrium annulatum]
MVTTKDIVIFSSGALASLAAVWAVTEVIRRRRQNEIPDTPDHKHCRSRIYAERQGRIAAERAIRADVVRILSQPSVGFPALVIGTVHSPYVSKRGTPRQGILVMESRGWIQLDLQIPVDALEGLDGYSHMFVTFIFHQNTNLPKILLRSVGSPIPNPDSPNTADHTESLQRRQESLKTKAFNTGVPKFAAKVCPPLLNGGNIGVLATRSPHHPNPIGQSLVRIESVDVANRRILISGFDMCDGTPVLDLKPWNPSDCPMCLHRMVDHDQPLSSRSYFCEKEGGDVTHSNDTRGIGGDRCRGMFDAFVPEWVEHGVRDPYQLPVSFNDDAMASLAAKVSAGELKFYKKGDLDLLVQGLKHILALDIRSFHQGRGKKGAKIGALDMVSTGGEQGQGYELDFDLLNVGFLVVTDKDGEPEVVVHTPRSQRLFELIDTDHDGHIDFCNFVTFIHLFSSRTDEKQKIAFLHRFCDLSSTGLVAKPDMVRIIQSILQNISISSRHAASTTATHTPTSSAPEHLATLVHSRGDDDPTSARSSDPESVEGDVVPSMRAAAELSILFVATKLVDETFEEADLDKDGMLSLKEFQAFANSHPSMKAMVSLKEGLLERILESAKGMTDGDQCIACWE